MGGTADEIIVGVGERGAGKACGTDGEHQRYVLLRRGIEAVNHDHERLIQVRAIPAIFKSQAVFGEIGFPDHFATQPGAVPLLLAFAGGGRVEQALSGGLGCFDERGKRWRGGVAPRASSAETITKQALNDRQNAGTWRASCFECRRGEHDFLHYSGTTASWAIVWPPVRASERKQKIATQQSRR